MEDFNIVLSKFWIIADGENYVLVGKVAECQTVLQFNELCDTMTCANLLDAVKLILK